MSAEPEERPRIGMGGEDRADFRHFSFGCNNPHRTHSWKWAIAVCSRGLDRMLYAVSMTSPQAWLGLTGSV